MNQDFFERRSATVAKALIGCHLVHEQGAGFLRGRVVETEAYYGNQDVKDPASHAFNGETERNQVMFGPSGRSYVYICYGIHYMLNVTTGKEGTPGAILIRAIEPLQGRRTMKKLRGVNDELQLCNGPGKLCQAFGITKDHNNQDMTTGTLRFEAGKTSEEVVQTTRVGISAGTDMELRFYEENNAHVSQP